MAYRVRLDVFEGPLDLLLHLVKKNEVDLSDLPVATITDQYLAYIDLLQQLDLDRAGEYLVMAATLLHLKSRLLLPSEEVVDEESGEDPRAELARQLLEYQRFREAAEMLDRNSMLGRDVFTRVPLRNEAIDGQDVVRDVMDEIYDVSLGDLLDALQEVLKNAEPGIVHQVLLEQVSLRERVCLVLDLLRERTQVAFTDLFSTDISRLQILVTFLAALELVRTRIIDINQDERFGPIMLTLAVSADAPLPETLEQL
jgi:segregation and condensation protein A